MRLQTWGEFKRGLEERGVRDDMLIGGIEYWAWADGVTRVDFETRGDQGEQTMFWAQ